MRPFVLLLLAALGCGERTQPSVPADGGSPGATPADPAFAGKLPDVAASSGIDFVHTHGGNEKKFLFETMGSGCAISDLDGDGRPELLFLQSGTLPPADFNERERSRAGHAAGETARLYHNQGLWRFRDVTAGSGLDEPHYDMGLAVGDVDADGDRDLYVAAYGRDRLYRNDGRARFSDVTAAARLVDELWTIGGAFFDADLDGDLDLYVLSYLDMPIASHKLCGPSREIRTYCHVDSWEGVDDRLWLNDGVGAFTDGSAAAALVGTRGKGLGVVGGDWDDDGDLDLFVANDSQPNSLLRNEGGGRFVDVGRESGTDLNAAGRTEACMGTDAGDVDGDGDAELYVTNFQQETNTLYRNDGDGFFTDVSVSSGAGTPSLRSLGFGTVFWDVENDGDLDLYVANGHIHDNVAEYEPSSAYAQIDQLYLNDGRGRFRLAPPETGPSLSVPRVGRGLARGDLDGDGDHDLAINNSNDRPWLLRNDLGRGHRIALRLAGPGGRADAEGARVTVLAGGRRLVRELHPGGSYASHNDTELLVGLGEASRVEVLEIRWPGGSTSRHEDLAADRRYAFAFGGELLRVEEL